MGHGASPSWIPRVLDQNISPAPESWLSLVRMVQTRWAQQAKNSTGIILSIVFNNF
jgi:hypothetical protein